MQSSQDTATPHHADGVTERRRSLPLLTPENRFFWQGGAEGALRFQRCSDCGRYNHPPGPVCRRCRSENLGMATVSGRAVVIGSTVNHYHWMRRFPPPYVVATVAIVEDPAVRLLTNIIHCDLNAVRPGMEVSVLFEEQDDVWFPVFEPTGGPDLSVPADEVAPQEASRSVRRPLLGRKRFEGDVAITGVGASEIGRRLMTDPLKLTVHACRRAIEDAGLEFEDIDGLATYPGDYPGPKATGAAGGFSEGGISAVEDALRIKPTWYQGGAETFGPTGMIVSAMLAVSAGLCRHALCFRTVWQSTHQQLARTGEIPSGGGGGGGRRLAGPMQWFVPYGVGSAAINLAQCASHHFHRYGTTKETLGRIALNARANAALTEDAVYRDGLTMEDYLSARPITSPFGLYDCDVPCDASIAVVVSAKETAADLRKAPVFIEAVGTQMLERVAWDQSTITHEPQVLGPAAHLWSRTTLRPSDVNLAELYDGFTFNCLSWIEALGFCGIGEAKEFIGDGTSISREGDLPVNTHGGQLSHGRTHGMGLLREAILQLRGEAGAHQIPGRHTAVVSSGGLASGGALLLRGSQSG